MTDSVPEGSLDPTSPGDVATPGQERPHRSIRRRLAFGAIAILVPLFIVRVGLTFLGAQVQSILAGTVEFGTGGSGCVVDGKAAAFTGDGNMHVAAHLRRDVKANEVIRLTITDAAGATDETEKTIVGTADCISMNIPLDGVDPGRYVFEYRVGSESLARGEVVISP